MPVDVTDLYAGCMGGWEIIFRDHLGGVGWIRVRNQ